MRRAARTDDNQTDIVKALRAIGCTVESLAPIGHGCPDLLVARNGVNVLMEVKDGAKSPSERRLTPMEQIWHDKWNATVYIVTNVKEALAAVGAELQ